MSMKILSFLFCFFLLTILLPITIYADMGPKPSVVIDFEGFEGEKYYVTLLSEEDSTGPYSSNAKIYDNQEDNKDVEYNDPWQKFSSYKDKDGYYFLNYLDDCSDNSRFAWTYYPPSKFKVLLYFPEYDKFLVSEQIYERYAFDSYFYVDAKDKDIQSISSGSNIIKAVKNYDFTFELITLFARIVLTIIIEIVVALCFGLTTKKQLFIIAVTNIFTQTILNVLLNIINYYYGSFAFIFNYIWMEAIVIMIEVITYSIFLNKYRNLKSIKKRTVIIYALLANIISFISGLYVNSIIL